MRYLLLLALLACHEEDRKFSSPPSATQLAQPPSQSYPFASNAWAQNDGKRLFEWMNCSGCHSHGGGGMGPALMDGTWRYGSDPASLYQTISRGRPNGMPAYGQRLPESEIWKLVAYVRSMTHQDNPFAAPTRNDELAARPAEYQLPYIAPSPEVPPP